MTATWPESLSSRYSCLSTCTSSSTRVNEWRGAPLWQGSSWRISSRSDAPCSRARRGIVLDPEDGWIRVRRNDRRVDRRRGAARVADVPRLVPVLDEHGSVRRVRSVGRRVALRINLGHLARLHRHECEAWVVMPAAVAAWIERDHPDTNVGRTLCLELDPVAVQLDGLVE